MTKIFETIFFQLHGEISSLDKAREDILELSRTIIRNASETIRAIHRKELERALEKQKEMKGQILRLHEIREAELRSDGAVQTAFQEYIEAILFYQFVSKEMFSKPEELKPISAISYIHGLLDLVGEIRRYCLDSLLHDDIDEASRSMEVMDDIYDHLVTLDYPSGLIPGVRKKTDGIRNMLEKMRGDIAIAFQRAKLEKRLAEVFQKEKLE